jgi:hypothetical protein
MSRFATSVGRAAVGSCMLCGALVAVPANAEPPGSPPIAEDTQKLFGLLSKGFIPDDCDAVDLVGGQRAAIICQVNREANGPISATYALYGDAKSLQSGFFTAIGRDDQLVARPWNQPITHGVPAPELSGSGSRPHLLWRYQWAIRSRVDQRRRPAARSSPKPR